MDKKKEKPLKVKTTFEELMKAATKGNPVPKEKRPKTKKIKPQK